MSRVVILLLFLLSLAVPLEAAEVKVYDKYWRLKYRVQDKGPEGLKVYDKYYRLRYRVQSPPPAASWSPRQRLSPPVRGK